MCLTLKYGQKAEIAKKDITVYKHARHTGKLGSGVWETPYLYIQVELNKLLTTKLLVDGNQVNGGFHSFTAKAVCLRDARDEYSSAVIKCTIPAGSRFYRGFFYGDNSIASDMIIYDEIIMYRKDRCNDILKPYVKPEPEI